MQKDLYLKYKNETFTKDDYDFIANGLDEFVLGCCPEINYLCILAQKVENIEKLKESHTYNDNLLKTFQLLSSIRTQKKLLEKHVCIVQGEVLNEDEDLDFYASAAAIEGYGCH